MDNKILTPGTGLELGTEMAAKYSRYNTHFYCALCGGPFAQVFRTATTPSAQEHAASSLGQTDVDVGVNGTDNDLDDLDDLYNVDADAQFTIPEEDNYEIPEEIVLSNMGYAALRNRDHRFQNKRPGNMDDTMKAWRAYDGSLISTAQMRWTRNLRALIHKRAQQIPAGGDFEPDIDLFGNHDEPVKSQFLSGRGRILQIDARAEVYSSYEEEDGPQGVHEFQVYREFTQFSGSAFVRLRACA